MKHILVFHDRRQVEADELITGGLQLLRAVQRAEFQQLYRVLQRQVSGQRHLAGVTGQMGPEFQQLYSVLQGQVSGQRHLAGPE